MTFELKNLGKKIHDMAMEDDPGDKKPDQTPVATAKPAPVASFPGFSIPSTASPVPAPATLPNPGAPGCSPFSVPTVAVVDEAVYQRILGKTDFDQTPVGKTIHRYFDALEDGEMDINRRLRMALRQAAKLDGLTPDQILAAFDGLTTALAAEVDKFGNAVDAQTQKEVTGRETELQQIAEQMTTLTQRRDQLNAELTDARFKVSNAQQQFQLATQRRGTEITQQKAQFAASLSKG